MLCPIRTTPLEQLQITPMQTEAFLSKNGGTSRRTENRRFLKKSIMLNRIRKNIQDNYTYCGIVHKPTAKQIAFLENKIPAQVLEDKDEYRAWYRDFMHKNIASDSGKAGVDLRIWSLRPSAFPE